MSETKEHGSAPQLTDIIAGKYRIEYVLGTGGMGVVFAATQLDLDRLVAVKVMRSELIEFPGAVQRLLLEAKLAAQFRSEHVCKVLDVGTLPDGVPFIVMEYLEGSDLCTLLSSQGPFEVMTAVDYVLEACEAIAEAHSANVVHRDLKPENLFVSTLLDGTPTIKVLDFGISKKAGPRISSRALTNPSAAMGSPYYMAPEQMRSARDVDLRADIWALGAILFELVTGSQAFEGDTITEVCAAVLSDPARRASEVRPNVPVPLAHAIDRCLRKDPEERFADVRELAAAIVPYGSPKAQVSLRRINRVLAGSGSVVKRSIENDTGLGVPTLLAGTDTRRRRRIWAAAGAGALALVVLAVTLMLGKRSSHAAPPSAASLAASSAAMPPVSSVVALAATPAPPLISETPAVAEVVAASAKPSSAAAPVLARALSPRHKEPAPAVPSAKPAPSTNTGLPKATEAWDTKSFGPRR